MGAKRIYECTRCLQYFRGQKLYAYHMNAHRRIDIPPPKVWYATKRNPLPERNDK